MQNGWRLAVCVEQLPKEARASGPLLELGGAGSQEITRVQAAVLARLMEILI